MPYSVCRKSKNLSCEYVKKYWITEESEEISAMIIETECAVDDVNLFTDLQTETCKDVRINPELTDDQRTDVLKVLEEFQDVFFDVPYLTNLGNTQST